MKVYILQATTYSDSAYNAYEWEIKGVFSTYNDADLVGSVYIAAHPDEEYFVGEFEVNPGLTMS